MVSTKKQDLEFIWLKNLCYYIYESLKPLNLVNNVFSQITAFSAWKGNLINPIIGIATGSLTKKSDAESYKQFLQKNNGNTVTIYNNEYRYKIFRDH